MNDTHNHGRIAVLILFLTFGTTMLEGPWAWAYEDAPIPIKTFHVSQENFRQNGVLVSRPRAIDQRVIELIAANKISTLEDYAAWLERNIAYQKDTGADHWAAPEETLSTKIGDCEDYAFLTSAVARVLGYEPQLIALVKASGRGHAICVFQDHGYFVWFDNAHLVKTPSRTFSDFVHYIMQNYNYSRLLKLDTTTEQWQMVYNKS